jgi:hypothetical protein
VSASRLRGWTFAPRIGVVVPAEGTPGWTDAALWCALLDAWGVPAERTSPTAAGATAWTTLVIPTAVSGGITERLPGVRSVLLTGPASDAAHMTGRRTSVTRFDGSADDLEQGTCEAIVDAAQEALSAAAPDGVVSVWRWPNGKDVALVVDGDVDHPTGVEPECSRYVAPAIETARRAGFAAYGIFAAAANVDAEPSSFPPEAQYYNHSYTHPYSYWNPEPWEALDDVRMREELTRSDETFRRHLGSGDHGIFRLPHFQLAASERTYDVLEALGYLADSSIGGNVAVTGGLPFHPARRRWSERGQDAPYARTHPEPAGRRPFLQIPIATDPTDTAFPHGCCSYNTLGEGVRNRTADPASYERGLEEVLDRACERQNLAHLFIDPPDAGYGRLPGDRRDYAGAVEAWLARAVRRDDVAVMSIAQVARWWLSRERAVDRLTYCIEAGELVVDIPARPEGTTLAVLPPGGDARWRHISPKEEAP